MNGWIFLWKTTFILGVVMFAGMSIFIIFGGMRDIRKLFERLKIDHKNSEKSKESDSLD